MSETRPSDGASSFAERHVPTLLRLFGGLGRPLLVRQLQADFRRPRFFVSHVGALVTLALALVVLMTMKADQENLTPTRVGRSLFSTFLLVQYVEVWGVFPAFSALAFSDERGTGSLELLTTTRLGPSELVWGKFLASLVYCLLYIIGSVPLLAIAFLFGGVPPLEVLVGYAVLIAATFLVSILGVCVSSFATGNVQAIVLMLAIAFLWLVFSYSFLGGSEALGEFLAGEETPIAPILLLLGQDTPFFLLISLGWGMALAIVFGYLFQFAALNVTVGAEGRSPALRALTLLAVPVALVLAGLSWLEEPPVVRMESIVLLAAGLLFTSAWLFSCESVVRSPRHLARVAGLRGVQFPLRLFLPGSASGALFATLLGGLVCVGGLVAWRLVTPETGAAEWRVDRFANCFLTLPVGVAAFSAFGFFLSRHEFAPRYARLTAFFSAIIVTLLPLIFYLRRTADAVWTFYYLSPITLWLSAEPQQLEEEGVTFELFGYELFSVARIAYGGLAAVLLVLGLLKARQARRMQARSTAQGDD